MPAIAQIDIERLADFARTIRYVLTRHAAPLFYYVQTLNRLPGTDQHTRAKPFRTAYDIAAMMHAVGKIDIHVAGAFEHCVITLGTPLERMACLIDLVIRLGLDNTDSDFLSLQITHQLAAK